MTPYFVFAITLFISLGLLFILLRKPKQALKPRPPIYDPGLMPMASETPALFTEMPTRFIESPRKKAYKLLNSAEETLYHRLVEAMPTMRVFCQVGVAQLAQLRGRQAQEDTRHMTGRCVDFLICREDFAILAAIELLWPSQHDPSLRRAEKAKRSALENLGIPLIVFRPNELPDAEAISREIAAAIVRRNMLEGQRAEERG